MPNVSNVSAGQPKVAGAVFRAPTGITLPTDASTALGSDFVDLGYVSEDGVTNNNTATSDSVKAWGGDTVLVLQTEKPDEWTLTLIEAMNQNVLKTVYGDANVTVATGGLITVKATAEQLADNSYVIDMKLKGGAMKRVVIPNGSLSEVGEIVYKDDEPIGYEITLLALPDTSGVTHYEYILPGSSGT